MSPKCWTLTDTGLSDTYISLVGGKSKSFATFEYLLDFLNKEHYGSNFTSRYGFDKEVPPRAQQPTTPVPSRDRAVSPLPAAPLYLMTPFCLLPNGTTQLANEAGTEPVSKPNKTACREPMHYAAVLVND